MFNKNLLLTGLAILIIFSSLAQPGFKYKRAPIESIKLIADNLIANTQFRYQLTVQKATESFNDIKTINFSRTFAVDGAAVGYALSDIESPADTTVEIGIGHSSGIKIWINGALAYQKQNGSDSLFVVKEYTVDLPETFSVKLKKGPNRLLVKSESRGKDWQFYIISKTSLKGLRLTLNHLADVDSTVAKLSDWLAIGPFPDVINNGRYSGLEHSYEPEHEFNPTKVYTYNHHENIWTIPKIELKAQHTGKQQAYGEYYNTWNYHCGGTAWAMAHLGDYTGIGKYKDYAKKYCDFYVNEKPFLAMERDQLGEMNNGDTRIVESHMLDFTAAPTLVYTYFLLQQGSHRDKGYEELYNHIENYVTKRQIRSPEGNFMRGLPHRHTIWADDMFMGIPFLMYSAQLAPDEKTKQALYNDAASQLMAFHKQLADPATGLYHHTQYLDRKANIAFWSRANGWAVWAYTEVLLHLPNGHPLYKTLLAQYKAHINTLIRYQDANSGFYHNVLDKPDSFAETSGTAIFTMAIARGINNGWLDAKKYKPYVLNGWKAIDSVIDDDGTIHGICIGTGMSENVHDYYTRPTNDNDTHGVFAAIFAAIEVDKLLNSSK